MDLSKLSTSDKVIAGSGLVLFIASFLPWFEVSVAGFSESGNGWDVGFVWAGIPALLGLAAAAVVLLTKAGTANVPDLPITWGQAFLAAGALSAILVVLKLIMGEDGAFGIDVDRAWGLFLATLAALAFAAGGFMKYREEQASGRSSI
ncbi:MAG: hypothetical protein Q8K58_03995 [Acidimicrobiales bacterium]|nr:hypothetical protein [Acidimicrobiales bacterium]